LTPQQRTTEAAEGEWLETIDHTADTGIRVQAGSLEELFSRSAYGMFTILTDVANVRPRHTYALTVEASDVDALLVEWLSELNFRHVTEGLLFCRFEVKAMSSTRMTAEASGESIDPAVHQVHTEIKAVTFHDLSLHEEEGLWTAQIIFDL